MTTPDENTLARIDNRLTRIEAKVEGSIDHEARIRALEIAMAKSAWIPIIITSVLTAVLAGGASKLIGG